MSNQITVGTGTRKEEFEMFDKLIESDTTGAEFKNRRSYFLVSSVVVGILFLSAVVFSIYAADISLGTDDFELSTLVAPTIPEVVPEPPEPETPTNSSTDKNTLPTRQASIARIDEHQNAPTETSVTPNTQKARPRGDYKLDKFDSDPPQAFGQREAHIGSRSESVEIPETRGPTPVPPPPPVRRSEPAKPRYVGVINGKATLLPKPPYPAPAIAINLSGDVNVQVTIDETGKVISAKAVSGHAFLRGAAERAAWKARFSPTYLGPTAVKVTGVIVYKFSRN